MKLWLIHIGECTNIVRAESRNDAIAASVDPPARAEGPPKWSGRFLEGVDEAMELDPSGDAAILWCWEPAPRS